MHRAIEIISDNYPAWEGTKMLELLRHYPGEPIYASVMERCLNEGLSPLEAQSSIYHFAPIRMTDESTIVSVKKRLNTLIAQKASAESCADANVGATGGSPALKGDLGLISGEPPLAPTMQNSKFAAIDAEINALTAYIKETTLPSGCIKCFGDDDTKAYRRIWAAISRLLKKAEADGHHEAVAIIKANLKQGKVFKWA